MVVYTTVTSRTYVIRDDIGEIIIRDIGKINSSPRLFHQLLLLLSESRNAFLSLQRRQVQRG